MDYGPRLGEAKGLIGEARINGDELRHWALLPLQLQDISPVTEALAEVQPRQDPAIAGPVFAHGRFDLPEPSDLFLSTSGWTKGVIWINGFCLGRYWSRGPQATLYVPGPLLRKQGNEIVVLELHASTTQSLSFVAAHDLGHTDF